MVDIPDVACGSGSWLGSAIGLVNAHSERIGNGIVGTVQGGAQSLLAELAAEHALGSTKGFAVTDLDIRFLDRLRVGPLVATATVLESETAALPVTVTLTDGGDENKIVSYVTITGHRSPSIDTL